MKFILQNRRSEVPEDVVLKLRDKHPSPLQELSDQEKQGIIQVDITDSCRELLGYSCYKHALDQGLGFLPIIFETTGQMHQGQGFINYIQ